MNEKEIGNDIKQGFDALAGGVKEAGRKRTAEMVSKNGYVAFKNPDAVAHFRADPYYANWNCEFVDGEYRFSPPLENNNVSKENEQVELFDSRNMPLSSNPKRRQIQEKIIKGEELTIGDKILVGRDHPVKQLYGHEFKPNYVYRSVSREAYEDYKAKGFVIGFGSNDEYTPGENNLGVDWYLGGVDPKYGRGEIILECPADKSYFMTASDNGCGIALDPTIRHMKSSGSKNPVPMTMIQIIEKPVLQQTDSIEVEIQRESSILDTYKKAILDTTKTTFVSVMVLQDDPSKCIYELISIDKLTGEKIKLQEMILDFNGKFSMETLPSIYYQLSDGFPAIDFEKEKGITFQNVDASKIIGFGNLSPEQLQLIKNMKEFVDSKYLFQEQEKNEFHR